MIKKWIKRSVLAVLLTPIILILLAIILLYVPPVQNYLRKEATAYASKATGMQITVERIDLRFPLRLLVRGVEVVQAPDTILTLESLSAGVQLFPLFAGRAELDDITLREARFNTADMIEGMRLSGVLGRFSLQSHGVDLKRETALINAMDLSDTHIRFSLNDTAASPVDTARTTINWQAKVRELNLTNVSFSMQLPADSTQFSTYLAEAAIRNVDVDMRKQYYGLERLTVSGASVGYDSGASVATDGFDPSHIALRDIRMGLDSIAYGPGMNIDAVIRELSMNERSGLSVTSMKGGFHIDSLLVRVPEFKLTTPHSELNLAAQVFRDITRWDDDRITARMNARIGKQDVLLFAGDMPDAFKKQYPAHPLVMQLNANGNANRIHVSRLSVELPGAFSLTGGGEVTNVPDSLNRTGSLEMQMHTQNLNFLTVLSGTPDNGALAIPRNMVLALKAGMHGPQYHAALRARESHGTLHLDAGYNTRTEAWSAGLKIDSLAIDHFLPEDSMYTLTAVAKAKGRGTDFTSSRTVATVEAAVNRLEYGRYQVDNIHLTGELRNAVASAHIASNNALLVMNADASYALNTPYTKAQAVVEVTKLDLFELGLIPKTFKKPVSFHLDANLGKDTVGVVLNAGDLRFRLRSRSTLEKLMSESTAFVEVLNKQMKERRLDHAGLRRALPSAAVTLNAGTDNPLYYYMALQNIKYNELRVGFVATPRIGINGRAAIHRLKVDTLQLDTVYFSIKQDTALMSLRSGVINGPRNPQFVFNASLTGEVRNEDAELTLNFKDGKGKTGVLLGVNARPETDGMRFRLIPEEPTVAFRTFSFNGHNTVFVRNNYRVLADVEMLDPNGMGLRVQSLEEADSTWLQNLDIEIRAIELAEVSRVLPYLPDISGLLFLEANYKQSPESMQVSAEGNVDRLFYENNRVGNLGLGVTWLPGSDAKHYLNAYMTNEGVEVLTADGTYETNDERLSVDTELEHFPLYITNAFIPDRLVELAGDLDGGLAITGPPSKPKINGELALDSVTVISPPYGFDFRFDNRPLQIKNSRLTFDKFAIYTTRDNPFTIDGYVDVADLSDPTANLSLRASNYRLLNAARKKDGLLYGKIFLDLNATVKGPASNLKMRGDIHMLRNTDVTYVMVDSPLSVQDRLGDLVEFTSFADTAYIETEDLPQQAPGGIDVNMGIHINPMAKIKVDLSPDRSSRIEMQGGGDLAFQYTPQGEMLLSGRYTLFGGTVRYALPVIPLKEFTVNNGSYVQWSGDPMDPSLNFKATERMRVSVPYDDGKSGSRMVNFDVSIEVKNKLNDLGLMFNLNAPDDSQVQRQLAAMDDAERSKQAITLMATGMYLASGSSGTGNFDMGAAFNSLLQSQIASLAGEALKGFSVGVDNYDGADGAKHTEYNFSYSQRLFNDRVQVVIGGTLSGRQNADGEAGSFIDNVSLEYRLDDSGTRYVRLFHNKEYENILESDITETGGGLVLRKKVNRLGELFIFRRRRR